MQALFTKAYYVSSPSHLAETVSATAKLNRCKLPATQCPRTRRTLFCLRRSRPTVGQSCQIGRESTNWATFGRYWHPRIWLWRVF